MANVRQLKDEINYVTYELINECITYRQFHPDKNGKVDKAISQLVRARNDLIGRINHPENKNDPKKLRAYFRKIKDDLNKLVKLVEDLSKE